MRAARAGCHQEGPWEEWGGAWSRSPCTAQEMQDLTFCLISALGCRIWASCNGFLGRSGTGSWILLRGLRGWALYVGKLLDTVSLCVCALSWRESRSCLSIRVEIHQSDDLQGSCGLIRHGFLGHRQSGRGHILYWMAPDLSHRAYSSWWQRDSGWVGGLGGKAESTLQSTITGLCHIRECARGVG